MVVQSGEDEYLTAEVFLHFHVNNWLNSAGVFKLEHIL